MCWAVIPVSRAAKSGESEQEVGIKHILQYLALTRQWCLPIRPHENLRDLTIVSDASLAPGGGRSNEGVT
eukprot:7985481-Prorocentrum_lima.AAC.1